MKSIRERRRMLNISQSKLAKLVNVNQTAISQWERGATTPSLPNACRLAQVLQCTVDDLFAVEQGKEVKPCKSS